MSRPRALLVLIGSVPVVLLVLVLVAGVHRDSPDQPVTTRSSQNVAIPRPEETAPAAAVNPVHRAPHILGRVCRPGGDTDRTSRARGPVNVMLACARQFPNVSFPVHDETGTTLSLLFVARDEVRDCAPALTAQVERLIPAEYLAPTAPSREVPSGR